ncbi:hypothetical protein GQ54DRAFT_299305 [Martensiomyces pterosporus]|nr:hypothetical protein GQ54DRAFT_299305 [Martensiomyces pterosporus]
MNITARVAGLVPLLVVAWCLRAVLQWTRSFALTSDAEELDDPHKLTWRSPLKYDIAAYATDIRSYYIDRGNFFSSAQRVLHIKDVDFAQKYPRFSKRVRIHLPESVRQNNGTTMYLHMFAQKAGQMNPHPLMQDMYMVFAHTELVAPRQLAAGGNGQTVAHGMTKVVWELVLEDHQFSKWKVPLDLNRMVDLVYLSPKERRAYNPISWENPLIASSAAHRWVPLTTDPAANSLSPLAAKHIDVDIDISGVTLEWVRASKYLESGISSQGVNDLAGGEAPLRRVVKQAAAASLDLGPLMANVMLLLCLLRLFAEAWAKKSDLEMYLQQPPALIYASVSPISAGQALLAASMARFHPLTGIAMLDSSLRIIRGAWFVIEVAKILIVLYRCRQLVKADASYKVNPPIYVHLLNMGVSGAAGLLLILRSTGADSATGASALDTYLAQALLLSWAAFLQLLADRQLPRSGDIVGTSLLHTQYVCMLVAAIADAVLLLYFVPLKALLPPHPASSGALQLVLDLARAYWPLLPVASLAACVFQSRRCTAAVSHDTKTD